MRTKLLFATIAALILSSTLAAQFPIKIPKIDIPKVEAPKTPEQSNNESVPPTSQTTNNSREANSPKQNSSAPNARRQMVMDDGYTFFGAEPVKVRNSRNDGDVDIGWYLVPNLRLMGTFPDNSAFRLKVKQNGKELSNFTCGAMVYRQKDDLQIHPKLRGSGDYDDFMYVWSKCSNREKAVKEIGWMDVEIYSIDGDTDEETLVRKHKIDVHKAERIRGHKPDLYPGVAEYYVQRYAEAAIGVITLGGRYHSYEPFIRPDFTAGREQYSLIMSHSATSKTTFQTYTRCSVNGTRVQIERDKAWLTSGGDFQETALTQRDNPLHQERITFAFLQGGIPTTLSPGKWECAFIENGVTFRKIRFDVGSDNKIIPHPEQRNGNINLYSNAFLVEVEIPAEATEMDTRSLPMSDAGLFYGIPWTTPEGKAAAAKLPKRGTPYPVLPK